MTSAAGSTQNRCVFVGNIPYDATEEQLIQICEEVGPVVSFRLVLDKETGKPKGYGFCEYKDEETALSARRNLQGYEINGRQLRVDFAENGKNADRNREQGRGGPGLASKSDAQSKTSVPSILGDSIIHQPVGIQLATSAATLMARSLGGGQSASNLIGVPAQHGAGSDPLTDYLSRMSQHHLNEILSELKTLATQNKELFSQLLQAVPQLSKALFQAEIILGMVTPQMMRKARGQQPLNLFSQSSHIAQIAQPELVLPIASGSLVANVELKQSVSHESNMPLVHVPQYQKLPLPQVPTYPQTILGASAVASFPSLIAGSSMQPTQHLVASGGFSSQGQPSLPPQHPISSGSDILQKLPQVVLEPVSRPLGNDSWSSHITAQVSDVARPGPAQAADYIPELAHPSKLRKLDNGAPVVGIANIRKDQASLMVGSSGTAGVQMANFVPLRQAEQQDTQLPPEVESALLQQVLTLTPEQLSSLPMEQQQQVIELQKVLSGRK